MTTPISSPSVTAEDTTRFIDPLAVVSIRIGAGYYQRVQQLLLFLMDGKTKQELDAAKGMIETNTCAKGSWQEQYMTILIFCQSFEEQIEKEKLFRVGSLSEL